ncbi:MAG: metal-dependent hydrolase [Phycisphaeraceae bacterium]
MPTPLAHGSLVLFARPLLTRCGLADLPRARRWGFYALVLAALLLPDADFAMLLLPAHPLHQHGTFTHSLAAALLFAPVFALVGRWLLMGRAAWGLLVVLGFTFYSAHVLMDCFTAGRGVMLFWPMSESRFASPVALFVGAEHSSPLLWRRHVLTLVNELALIALLWPIGTWLERRARRGGSRMRNPEHETPHRARPAPSTLPDASVPARPQDHGPNAKAAASGRPTEPGAL